MLLGLLIACTGQAPVPGADDGPDLSALPGPACEPLSVASQQVWGRKDMPDRGEELRSASGIGAGDIDGDGDIDLLVSYTGGSFLLRNQGGELWVDDTATLDGAPLPPARGTALVDLDEDGDLDAFLSGDVGEDDRIAWNDGTAAFTGQTLPNSQGYTTSGSFGDFDEDGRIDLFVARSARPDYTISQVVAEGTAGDASSLYLQTGDGTFTDASAGLPGRIQNAHTFLGVVLDADGDGHLDLYLSNDFGPWVEPNALLLGDGTGGFAEAECGCDVAMYGMGGAVGDANNDGAPDLYLTNLASPILLENDGGGFFYDATASRGAAIPADAHHLTSWGTRFVDLDQDADEDLVVAFGRLNEEQADEVDVLDPTWTDPDEQRDVILLSDGRGGFSDETEALGYENPWRNRGLSAADLDGDGRPEVITIGKNALVVTSFSGGCDPGIILEIPGGREIGARVDVDTGVRQYTRWFLPAATWSSAAPELYLGLGRQESADIDITWPDGSTMSFAEVQRRMRLVVESRK